MKFEVEVSGASGKKKHVVELERDGVGWRVALDGTAIDGDVVEIAPHTFSVLLGGQSHEIRVSGAPDGTLNLQNGLHEFTAEVADPRAWRGRRHGHIEVEGRQQIVAPMPGKVIRVLVEPGQRVEAGQGVLVVEAMKMQNEIRSPKSGTIGRVLVEEGQPVNAGDALAWVE
jgi:biotin carboxyl carrier protein